MTTTYYPNSKKDVDVEGVDSISPTAYYTTKTAARLMAVSLRTAQLWCDSGILEVMRTPGGHRRILGESILRRLAAANPLMPSTRSRIVCAPGKTLIRQSLAQRACAMTYPVVFVDDYLALLKEISHSGVKAVVLGDPPSEWPDWANYLALAKHNGLMVGQVEIYWVTHTPMNQMGDQIKRCAAIFPRLRLVKIGDKETVKDAKYWGFKAVCQAA